MTQRPPFRADHVGSFLRPEKVKKAREMHAEGRISSSELRKVEDEEICELIKKQQQNGLIGITDGECRRSWWHLDFFAGLDGIKKVSTEKGIAFHGVQTKPESVALEGKVDFSNHPMIEDFNFLQANVPSGHVAKMTIPSPAMLHFVLTVRDLAFTLPPYYPSDEELRNDIANAYKKAIAAFYSRGCRYLQLDDTSWGALCSEDQCHMMKERGISPQKLIKDYVELINKAIADRPADMAITMHICRGNFRSTWTSSGGYEPVAEELFGKAKLDGFFLEYDSERAGDFKPLRFIKDQKVVLGLITSKTGAMEDKKVIKERIAEASEFVPLEQLCLSPQCGFSSTEEGNVISEEDQWAKIRFVVELAKEVWK